MRPLPKHFYDEKNRAKLGAEAWRKGDLDYYGKLIFDSGYSSIHNYECGCDELIRLYDILHGMEGVYGARFSGAGFKGCCMALIFTAKLVICVYDNSAGLIIFFDCCPDTFQNIAHNLYITQSRDIKDRTWIIRK